MCPYLGHIGNYSIGCTVTVTRVILLYKCHIIIICDMISSYSLSTVLGNIICMGFLRSWTLTRQNILCLVLDRDEVSLTEEARGGRQLDLESWIVDSVEVDSEGRKELLCVVSLANKPHKIFLLFLFPTKSLCHFSSQGLPLGYLLQVVASLGGILQEDS